MSHPNVLIQKSDRMGLGLFLSKDSEPIEVGSVALRLSPLVHSSCGSGKFCDACFEPFSVPARGRLCTGCRTYSYCNPICQRADWDHFHKYECKLLKSKEIHQAEVYGYDRNDFRFFLRCVLMLRYHPEDKAKFSRLPMAKAHRRQDEFELLKAFESFPSEAEIAGVGFSPPDLHRMIQSRFQRDDLERRITRGSAIYDMAPYVNHSCDPSCLMSFEGNEIVFTVCRKGGLFPGEEITYSYLPFEYTKAYRMECLMKDYGFTCRCDQCMCEEVGEQKVEGMQSNSTPEELMESILGSSNGTYIWKDHLYELRTSTPQQEEKEEEEEEEEEEEHEGEGDKMGGGGGRGTDGPLYNGSDDLSPERRCNVDRLREALEDI